MLNTASHIPFYNSIAAFYQAITVPPPAHPHFDVRRIQDNLKTVRQQMPPFRNNAYMFSLTLKGVGTERVSGLHSFVIGDFTLFFTAPGQLQSWNVKPGWEGIYAIFTEEFFASNAAMLYDIRQFPFFNADGRTSILLRPEEADELLLFMQLLEKEIKQNQPDRLDFVRLYLHVALLHCGRFYKERMLEGKRPPDPQPAGVALVRQFQELLKENFRSSANRLKTVQEFADTLRVHPNHLSATTKETLGKTAGELLQERLLTEARALLLHSDLTVKEIAYQLDFETPNYFFRFFKKHTGRTPGAFRSQI